jgi:Sigma-70, region 4
MASLDSLPPDQRAVLDLVLQRGRSYDDIAGLLAIDQAAVRSRALAALERLEPDTDVPPERRALISDYLLGQLPEALAGQTRERLAQSPNDRAWARVLAAELGAVANKPLPDIPSENGAAPETREVPAASTPESPSRRGARAEREREREQERERGRDRSGSSRNERPSSRTGGAIMLGIGVLAAVAVVVIIVLNGSSSKHHTSTNAASAPKPATTAPSTGTSTASAHIVSQINLNPPSASSSAKGIAVVVQDGSAYGIIIEAQHLAANDHDAYAVWLANSPSDSTRLGFVSPAVGKNGQMQIGNPLPANAGRYHELLLTLETQSAPKAPGATVLAGQFKGVPPS